MIKIETIKKMKMMKKKMFIKEKKKKRTKISKYLVLGRDLWGERGRG